MVSGAKRAYDKAAEAFCDHVLGCADCTMQGPHCEIGDGLLYAENEAWAAYRNAGAAAADGGLPGRGSERR